MNTRTFAGRAGAYVIPKGAEVELVRCYRRGKALVRYDGREVLTITRLLRKLQPSPLLLTGEGPGVR